MSQAKTWRGNRRGRYSDGFRARGGSGNRMNGQFGGNRNDFNDHKQTHFGRYFQQRKREAPTKRLSEEDIGVTEYMNDHEGFNGIIKSRYSDFQVSEINLDGEIAKLSSQEYPELPEDKGIDEDEDLVLNKYNLEILPMETWDDINKLVVARNICTEKVQIDVTGMTKEERTKIHDAVKKAFGSGIIGSTVTVGCKKYVSIEKFRKGVRIDKRVKWLWPGDFTHFILHKENCDTMEAASRLAERLRVSLKPSVVGYAGTKDRRAKTSQWFSLRKVAPARIAEACRDLREIHVGNYRFRDQGLRLGMLRGNKFRVTLRNVTASDECITAACTLLHRDGFINYYGLQRFGTRIETPTYEIGLRLFQGKLFEAIQLILEQRSGPLSHVLQVFHEQGAAAAWRASPRGTQFGRAPSELRLIRALATDPNDLARAFDTIPRNVRLLYIHSYQSLVWNKVVTRRLQKYGLKPVVGDLVPLRPIEIPEEHYDYDEVDFDSEETLDMMETDDNNEKAIDKSVTDTTANTATPTTADSTNDNKKKKETGKEGNNEIEVKILTQEDVDSGKYTICDIVLPLPGQSIQYPPNMVDYYKELLTKDGLTLEMKNRIKQFSMSGTYRPLAVRPGGMQWRCVRYSDPFCDLVLSDLDELEGRVLPTQPEDGKFKALLLTFTLSTSCYATMALRELLKVDTSCDNQALQNNYHKVKARETEKQNEMEGQQSEEKGCDSGDKRKLEQDSIVDAKKVKQDV